LNMLFQTNAYNVGARSDKTECARGEYSQDTTPLYQCGLEPFLLVG
jgi:hypothetical protein